MLVGSRCDCVVCRMEKSLAAELGRDCARKAFQLQASSGDILARFSSPLDLVSALHASTDPNGPRSADRLLAALLRENEGAPAGSVWLSLLLLVFVPTIHRTASQIRVAFPSLARDDVGQHVLSVFLDFLHSADLATRRSHLAFAVARSVRRGSFRWAIHEARLATPEEIVEGSEEILVTEPIDAAAVLERFLDNCQILGYLSAEERKLLVEYKLEHVSSREIAGRNGHSSCAARHRIHRILRRLRSVAAKNSPRQLRLFKR